uniref:Transmembrane protein n=1 Tax=Cucumis melo TaxID=3656 RepID=A0A9I9CES6_CUCME
MERNYGFLVCILVMVIDVVAGLLGIEAEKAQNRVVLESLSISVGECSRKPRDDAFSRGLAAAILLGLAHVIATVLGGCKITLGIGFSLLMAATMDNSKWKNSCEISSHGLFLGGGIVCFLHGLCTVAYYVSATAAYREEQRGSKPSPEPQRIPWKMH